MPQYYAAKSSSAASVQHQICLCSDCTYSAADAENDWKVSPGPVLITMLPKQLEVQTDCQCATVGIS